MNSGKTLKRCKTSPIPVRFELSDTAFLNQAANETGMSHSELVRRSVRLMRQQRQMFKSFSFVIDLA